MTLKTAASLPNDSAHEVSSRTSKAAWVLLWTGVSIGLILILYHSTHTPTYPIDSYFYLSKAEQFISGKGLTTSWNSGVDPKYFPGYSLILALSFALGGSHIPVQLITYLSSVALLIIVLKELTIGGIQQALAATAFSVNPITIKWYSLPMAEGVALALALAALLFFLRFIKTKRGALLFAAGISGGLAVITRMEALFLLFIFIPLLYSERKSLKIGTISVTAAIFFLPLLVYLAAVRDAAGSNPAYVREFGYTLAKFNLLKNFLYNLWVPFGLMQHWPLTKYAHTFPINVLVGLAGIIWLLVGLGIFGSAILWGITGRLGSKVRKSVFLFLLYAGLHALWYYRYERFMLLVLPVCAFLWSSCISFFNERIHKKHGKQFLLPAQAMLIISGLALGYLFSSTHAFLLQQDTSRLDFAEVATAVNKANESNKPVLTDLGPHLAFYIKAHSYMDDDHGNYWQRAFPPERTLEELNRLGIRLIVTKKPPSQWIAEHYIPPEKAPGLQQLRTTAGGVTVMKYVPPDITGS